MSKSIQTPSEQVNSEELQELSDRSSSWSWKGFSQSSKYICNIFTWHERNYKKRQHEKEHEEKRIWHIKMNANVGLEAQERPCWLAGDLIFLTFIIIIKIEICIGKPWNGGWIILIHMFISLDRHHHNHDWYDLEV